MRSGRRRRQPASPADRNAPARSALPPLGAAAGAGRLRHPIRKAGVTTSMLTAKIARHPPISRITPPIVGPTAAATAIPAPSTPKARARRCSGTSSRIRANPLGTITAPEAAWSTRNATSGQREGARGLPPPDARDLRACSSQDCRRIRVLGGGERTGASNPPRSFPPRRDLSVMVQGSPEGSRSGRWGDREGMGS